MWNPSRNPEADEDDSWEVRAFAEDTSDAMGATWPPRSYTCTFCRREFRSAQALGGHMNVHRRDRARLHQPGPSTSSVLSSFPVPPPSMNHPLLLPSRDFMASDGLWFQLYQQLPNPNISDPGSALLSVWPYNLPPNVKYPQSPNSVDFSAQPRNLPPFYRSDQLEASSSSETSEETRRNNIKKSKCSSYSEPAIEEHDEDEDEEIDLELRLGRSRRPPH